MPFINIQVSDDLYQHARLAAARRNMSVSALMRALLVTIQEQPSDAQPDGKEFGAGFSPLNHGNINREKTAMLQEHMGKQQPSGDRDSFAYRRLQEQMLALRLTASPPPSDPTNL